MARCQNCNKFTALELQEPELENCEHSLELDEETGDLDISVSFSARIVRTSECCGDEMKEASLEAEESVTIDREQLGDAVEQVDGKWQWRDGVEPDFEYDDPLEAVEEGGGRYAKSYFGASLIYRVTVGENTVHEGTLTDKVAASHMDELC